MLALLMWAGLVQCLRADDPLQLDDAWIRALPPGMGMTAGFGTFRNNTSEVVEITSFSSEGFDEVSLHRTETVDGMSRMIEVPTLEIGPGESVELAPGGYHLMLMKATAPVQAGDTITLTVRTTHDQEYRFRIPVVRR